MSGISFFDSISILDIALSIFGLALTLIITYRQSRISKSQSDLLTYGSETIREVEKITKTLKTDEETEKQVEAFFKITQNHRGYRCIYPYENTHKVIPSLRIGDSYAILILERLFAKHKLKKSGIIRGDGMNCENNSSENCLIICTCLLHKKNATPYPTIKDTKESLTSFTQHESLGEFPCWFIKGTREINKETKTATGILIQGEHIILSKADNLYLMDEGNKNTKSNTGNKKTHDFGVISRIRDQKDGKDYILLAGIHSIGTWISVHYLDNLLRNKVSVDKKVKQHIFGDNDFILILKGEFSIEDLRVTESHKFMFWWRSRSEVDSEWKNEG